MLKWVIMIPIGLAYQSNLKKNNSYNIIIKNMRHFLGSVGP